MKWPRWTSSPRRGLSTLISSVATPMLSTSCVAPCCRPRPSARSSCSSFAAAYSCSARASSRFQLGPPAARWPWWPWWTCGRSTATTSTTTTSPTPSCAAKIWRRKRRPTSRFYLTPTPTTACSTTPWATPSAKTPRAIGTRTLEATMPPNCNATKISLSAISIRSMQRFIKL